MEFCLDKRVIGTKKHLVVNDEERTWVSSVPPDTWHYSGQLKDDSEWCADTLLKLNCVLFNVAPDKKYTDSISCVVTGSTASQVDVPWQSCMPHSDHKRFVDECVCEIDRLLNLAKTSYYKGTCVIGTRLLKKLQQPYVDVDRWQ